MFTKFKHFVLASVCLALAANNVEAQNINAVGNNEIILHAWSWSFNTISQHLQEIKDAGFTIVQTSPINECYVGDNGGRQLFGNGKWYYHYQPTDWTIGNYQLGTRDEFKDMCDKAGKLGLRVIVDVLPNHTVIDRSHINARLDSAVNGRENLFHANGLWPINDYSDRYQCTTGEMGRLPDVNTENPDLRLNVHIGNDQLTVSLDSSGESLHKRGYRVATTEAPMSEVLAAGMLLMAGWKGQSDFYDPMCGSGTLPIEAALIARNIAPGVFRQSYAFEKWPDFDAELWSDIYNDDSREREFNHKIYGSDASFYAIQQATKNVKSAGVAKDIELKQVRMEELKLSSIRPFDHSPLVMINPPYGERLASNKDMEELYGKIGTALKHQFTGATAWIISSNAAAMKYIGLKPSKKMHLLNGELDCQFNQYELFQGKRKDNNQ